MRKALLLITVIANSVLVVKSIGFVIFAYGYNVEPLLLLFLVGIVINLFGVYLYIKKIIILPLFTTALIYLFIMIDDVGLNLIRVVKDPSAIIHYICVTTVLILSVVMKLINTKNKSTHKYT